MSIIVLIIAVFCFCIVGIIKFFDKEDKKPTEENVRKDLDAFIERYKTRHPL